MAEKKKTTTAENTASTQAAPAANQATDNINVMAALAYIIFFIPLLTHPGNEYGKYHANQGLNLLILGVAVNVIGAAIPFLGWFIILPFGTIAILILLIMGLVNALNGQKKPLPLIGGFQLIK